MSKPRSGNPAPFVALRVEVWDRGKRHLTISTPKIDPRLWNDPDDRRLHVRFAIAQAKLSYLRGTGNVGLAREFLVYVNGLALTQRPCGRQRIVEALSGLPPVRTVMA